MRRHPSPVIRRGAAAVSVAAALLVGASCSGGGGSDADLAFADWQAQAEAVCQSVRQEAAADQPVTGAGNPAVPIRARAVAIDQAADRLSDLGQPDEKSDEVQDLLDAMGRQVKALNELADALLADPTATSGTAGAAVTVETDKVDTTATELGVPSCTTVASTDPTEATPSSDPSNDGFGDQGQTQEG